MSSTTGSHAGSGNNNNNNKNNADKNADASKISSTEEPNEPVWLSITFAVMAAGLLQVLFLVAKEAYRIRLYAIEEFGRVIHEFDPYFNYRATVYLHEHGWKAFSQWFDYMSWYPLGRPVGTTIYPGMQVTAVWLKNHLLPNWSINDICVFIPAWFGVAATLAVAWLTLECSRESGSLLENIWGVSHLYRWVGLPIVNLSLQWLEAIVPSPSAWGLRTTNQSSPIAPYVCAVAAASIMSVVPAHLLRSIGGGYDNESIAMTAMVLTFACWTCSLRDFGGKDTATNGGSSKIDMPNQDNFIVTSLLGALTGIAYFYMVASWGGYVFVLNMIAAHAGFLVLIGRYSTKLHRAYTVFYITGTTLAIQVPVVGWTPVKSLEQMLPLLGFVALQLIEVVEMQKRKYRWNAWQTWKARINIFLAAGAIGCVVAMILAGAGYFGPISSRVRGLFVQHTKTGNPLVDSVAEHQKANPQAYWQYLFYVCYLLPIGLTWTSLRGFGDSSSFLIVYGVAAYYFSLRMVRLILLTAPIASALGGIAMGRVICFGMDAVLLWSDDVQDATTMATVESTPRKKTLTNKKGKRGNGGETRTKIDLVNAKTVSPYAFYVGIVIRLVRVGITAYLVRRTIPLAQEFHKRCHDIAKTISHPTIIQKAQTRQGETVVIDDYREAYHWLRDNTPEDARVMAWWDYGYQITGIGNRTTLADGNTWNHEHIALLGRTLTAPEKEAHRIARHLADYVLVWAGGGGDDLAKSPHLRRIANSVYRGLCREPTCRDFGFYSDRTPTENMKGSLLYILHSNGIVPEVRVDPNRFREVFRTKYGKVRIYKIQSVSKESKDWVESNRVCDAPGSWYCPGQYPPALEPILQQKKDFAQLEDFNRGKADDEYTKEYFENLHKTDKDLSSQRGSGDAAKKQLRKLKPEVIDKVNEKWEDNELSTLVWELISKDYVLQLRDLIIENPLVPHVRSADGRGPMWWAHEYGRTTIIEMLKRLGVSEDRKDAKGITPLDVSKMG